MTLYSTHTDVSTLIHGIIRMKNAIAVIGTFTLVGFVVAAVVVILFV